MSAGFRALRFAQGIVGFRVWGVPCFVLRNPEE